MNVDHIIFSQPISAIWKALGGDAPRRGRARAFYREGDNRVAVSLNDEKGCWHDFVTGEGGGVLDLVVRVRGGSRQDALRWAADFVGCPLDDRPLSAFERALWAKRQQQIALELPKARLWRRAAVALAEQVLAGLKAALADPTLTRPGVGEIAHWTTQLAGWRRLDGTALVAEFLWWAEHEPHLTRGMLYASELRETAERRALCFYLRMMQPEGRI
jgi:hypothetical protein